MNATAPVQVIAWIITGFMAAWFLYAAAGRGPLGLASDYIAAAVAALLGGLFTSLATGGVFSSPVNGQQPLDQWWLTIPVAFLSGTILNLMLRGLFRARRSP